MLSRSFSQNFHDSNHRALVCEANFLANSFLLFAKPLSLLYFPRFFRLVSKHQNWMLPPNFHNLQSRFFLFFWSKSMSLYFLIAFTSFFRIQVHNKNICSKVNVWKWMKWTEANRCVLFQDKTWFTFIKSWHLITFR